MQHQPEIPVARYHGPKTRSMTRASSSATRQQSPPRNTSVSLQSLNASHAHHQQQSPLWGKLPAEIRNQIFDLAVSQHLDPAREYPVGSYYRRPGYTHAFRVCTALLQTCRLAWLEANSIPMRSATIPIWECGARGPPRRMRSHNPRIMCWEGRPSCLTAANVRDLEHVHFFTQLVWLEPGGPNFFFKKPLFRPRRVTITIRHSDWWSWESDEDLHLQQDFDLRLPPTTEQLVFEFETILRKKSQLDSIVARYRGRTFTRPADNAVFSAVGEPTEWRWSGELDGYGLQDYVVVVVTWKPPQTRK